MKCKSLHTLACAFAQRVPQNFRKFVYVYTSVLVCLSVYASNIIIYLSVPI